MTSEDQPTLALSRGKATWRYVEILVHLELQSITALDQQQLETAPFQLGSGAVHRKGLKPTSAVVGWISGGFETDPAQLV